MEDIGKAEAALEIAVHNTDLLVVSGSRLYGTETEDSDFDLIGFVIPPFEYLLGLKNFECRKLPDKDHKIFSLRRFLDLVLGGDPACTELFFVPPEKIIAISDVGKKILSLRSCIISQAIYRRIMGYSYSEWRKAMGQKMIIEERSPTENTVVEDIRTIFQPDKDDMDHVLEILLKDKERQIVPSKVGLGEKRRKEFETCGYGVSSACHAIRLLDQVCQLMCYGEIKFPSSKAQILKQIRNGQISKIEAQKLYDEYHILAGNAKKRSVLPDKPDRNKVMMTYLD
ncbi:unnamed protein product, partial [marine sediment metagenome]